MTPRRFSHIGVDLSGRWLKAAQLVRRGTGGWRLHAACRIERTDPAAPYSRTEIDALLAAITRQGCEGNSLVLGVPPQLTVCSSLELPPRTSGAPIAQIARLELARTARVAPESFEIAMWDVPPPGRGGEGTYVLAVGLAHEHAERILSLFDDTGFDVARIDSRACGLGRAVGTDSAGASLLVDLGWDHTSLIMLLGGRVLYERVLTETSLASLYRAAHTRSGLEPRTIDTLLLHPYSGDEADTQTTLAAQLRGALTALYDSLATEVTRSIAYAAHRYVNIPLSSVVLSGDGALLPGLAERIRHGDTPTRTLIPGELFELGPSAARWARTPALSAALGLAVPALTALAKEAA